MENVIRRMALQAYRGNNTLDCSVLIASSENQMDMSFGSFAASETRASDTQEIVSLSNHKQVLEQPCNNPHQVLRSAFQFAEKELETALESSSTSKTQPISKVTPFPLSSNRHP